ncbi:MAG: YkgJ family cysteine cluster protein [Desulfobacteraceae bacterium]|jgi:Fe-S-cluster containining protein
MPNSEPPQKCQRCGICCRKGGPALHKTDRELVLTGAIGIDNLLTIRPGELVFNQFKNKLEPSLEDIIKIKGTTPNTWCCIFFDSNQKSCHIYPDRPLECRILKCWDTQHIESEYCTDRLQRKDILGHISGLMELIDFHHNYCNPQQLHEQLENLSSKNVPHISPHVKQLIIESIHWDERTRQLAQEKAKISPEQFNFVFGRPIRQILKLYGWEAQKKDSKIYLRRTSVYR